MRKLTSHKTFVKHHANQCKCRSLEPPRYKQEIKQKIITISTTENQTKNLNLKSNTFKQEIQT